MYFVLEHSILDLCETVHIAGMTANPDGNWMAQQARNMCMFFDDWPFIRIPLPWRHATLASPQIFSDTCLYLKTS